MIDQAYRCSIFLATSVAGFIVATTGLDDEKFFGVSVNTVRELGSFGLVALFVLGVLWLIKAMVPKALEVIEKTMTSFLEELRLERQARETNMRDFREMLQSHKEDIGKKIIETNDVLKEGNRIMEELVEQIGSRPCQIKK